AGGRHRRRAARAHRLRRPARHRGDDPPAAAGGLPALRVPPRARPARSRRGAPRPQGDAAPPPRLLRRPADRPAARPRMTYAEAVAEDAVADGFDAIAALVARLDATMFEVSTALALDHFAREAVDVAVLEVGLGGRLDATTVGTPAVTALARIDLDHQEVLGETLAAIAAEKAAIIRSGVAVSAAQAPEAAEVLIARAAAVGVPLLMEGRELSVRVRERGLAAQTIDCAGPGWRLEGLRLPLLGVYQPSNALVALAAARALGVGDAAAREGLARARWPGRFEVLRAAERVVVLDGAHNPAGAAALAASLGEWFGDTPL